MMAPATSTPLARSIPSSPRRTIDLQNLRAFPRLEHVDAGDFEAHDPRGRNGRAPVAPVEHGAHPEAPSVQVRPEFPRLGLASHGRHDAPADDNRAKVPTLGLRNILLQDDVLAHGPKRLEQRRDGLGCLRDHRSYALRALLELHDARRAPRDDAPGRSSPARPCASRHRHVDVLLGEKLHCAQLVARSGDREGRVEDGDPH